MPNKAFNTHGRFMGVCLGTFLIFWFEMARSDDNRHEVYKIPVIAKPICPYKRFFTPTIMSKIIKHKGLTVSVFLQLKLRQG